MAGLNDFLDKYREAMRPAADDADSSTGVNDADAANIKQTVDNRLAQEQTDYVKGQAQGAKDAVKAQTQQMKEQGFTPVHNADTGDLEPLTAPNGGRLRKKFGSAYSIDDKEGKIWQPDLQNGGHVEVTGKTTSKTGHIIDAVGRVVGVDPAFQKQQANTALMDQASVALTDEKGQLESSPSPTVKEANQAYGDAKRNLSNLQAKGFDKADNPAKQKQYSDAADAAEAAKKGVADAADYRNRLVANTTARQRLSEHHRMNKAGTLDDSALQGYQDIITNKAVADEGANYETPDAPAAPAAAPPAPNLPKVPQAAGVPAVPTPPPVPSTNPGSSGQSALANAKAAAPDDISAIPAAPALQAAPPVPPQATPPPVVAPPVPVAAPAIVPPAVAPTPPSADWQKMQDESARSAVQAGLPAAGNGYDQLNEAVQRTHAAGYQFPHFIGQPDATEGDRAPTMDQESLVSALQKQETDARTKGDTATADKVAKERTYWQAQIDKNGMTAEQWKAQTGEDDPQHPGAFPAVATPDLIKSLPLDQAHAAVQHSSQQLDAKTQDLQLKEQQANAPLTAVEQKMADWSSLNKISAGDGVTNSGNGDPGEWMELADGSKIWVASHLKKQLQDLYNEHKQTADKIAPDLEKIKEQWVGVKDDQDAHNAAVQALNDKVDAQKAQVEQVRKASLDNLRKNPTTAPFADQLEGLDKETKQGIGEINANPALVGPAKDAALKALQDQQNKKGSDIQESLSEAADPAKRIAKEQTIADSMGAVPGAAQGGKEVVEQLAKEFKKTPAELEKIAAGVKDRKYSIGDDGGIQFNSYNRDDTPTPDEISQAVEQAAKDGVLNPEKLPELRAQVQKAKEEYDAIVKAAGSAAPLKAVLRGAGKGGAFLAGSIPGAKGGAALGALVPVAGETGIPEAIGAAVGALATGTAAAWGYDETLKKLGNYFDSVNSVNKAAELNPGYAQGGELASFVAAPTKIFSKGAWAEGAGTALKPAVVESIQKYKKLADIAADSVGEAGTSAAVDVARNTAAMKAVLKSAGSAATGGALFTASQYAFDAGRYALADVAGIKHDELKAPGLSDLATNVGLGVLLHGQGLAFKDYSPADVASILTRAQMHKNAGRGYGVAGDPADIIKAYEDAGVDTKSWSAAQKEEMTSPLSPEEIAVYKNAEKKTQDLKNSGALNGASGVDFQGARQATIPGAFGKNTPIASAAVKPKFGEEGGATKAPLPALSPITPAVKMAASDAELANADPADPATAAANVVRDLVTGAKVGDMTEGELNAVGLTRPQNSDKPKALSKDAAGNPVTPSVHVDGKGNAIVLQPALDALKAKFPATAQLANMSEKEARAHFNSPPDEQPIPTNTNPPAKVQAEPVDETPAAKAVPATVEHAAALEKAADTLEQAGKSHNVAPLRAEAAAIREKAATKTPAPAAKATTPAKAGDGVRQWAEKQLSKASTPEMKSQAAKSPAAGKLKLIADGLDKYGDVFNGVEVGDTVGESGLEYQPDTGNLHIDPKKFLSHLEKVGGTTRASVEKEIANSLLHEKEHRLSTLLDVGPDGKPTSTTDPQFADDLAKMWESIPAEVKTLQATAYYKKEGAAFPSDWHAKHEWWADASAKLERGELPQSLDNPALWPQLKKLIGSYIKALENWLAKAPQEIKDRFARTLAKLKALDARIAKGELEPKAATVDEGAHEAATSTKNDLPHPTEAQQEAGNYKKGPVKVSGMDISVENPAGSKRRPEWPTLKDHYGYFLGTVDGTGEHLDVFIKPGTPLDYEGPVFVVNQKKADGSFDEHKVVLGVNSAAQAVNLYRRNYAKGWKGFDSMATFPTVEAFKEWMKGDLTGKAKSPKAEVDANKVIANTAGMENTFPPPPPAPPATFAPPPPPPPAPLVAETVKALADTRAPGETLFPMPPKGRSLSGMRDAVSKRLDELTKEDEDISWKDSDARTAAIAQAIPRLEKLLAKIEAKMAGTTPEAAQLSANTQHIEGQRRIAETRDAGVIQPTELSGNKPKPINMAGETRPEKPAKSPLPEYGSLPQKTRDKFEAAYTDGDTAAMKELLYPTNKVLRAEFVKRAGLNALSATLKGTNATIDQWAKDPSRAASTVPDAKNYAPLAGVDPAAFNTPLLKEWLKIRSALPDDAILLFRLGDFYEAFARDAKDMSGVLQIALTKRNGIPMAGIPHHAAESYIKRLVAAGLKVAVADKNAAGEPWKVTPAVAAEPSTVESFDLYAEHDKLMKQLQDSMTPEQKEYREDQKPLVARLEALQTEITKRNGQEQFSVYPHGSKWAIQQTATRQKFGDQIFDTKAEADAQAAKDKEMAKANAEHREKAAATKKTEDDAAAAKVAPLNAYLDEIKAPAMQRGKLFKVLNSWTNKSAQSGKSYVGPRFEAVRSMVTDGYAPKTEQVKAIQDLTGTQSNRMDNREQEAFAKKQKAAGTKTEYRLQTKDGSFFVVTKIEHDLAKYFHEQPSTQPNPLPPSNQPEGQPGAKVAPSGEGQDAEGKEEKPDALDWQNLHSAHNVLKSLSKDDPAAYQKQIGAWRDQRAELMRREAYSRKTPAIWTYNELITTTGKYSIDDSGKLTKLNDLSERGYQRNVDELFKDGISESGISGGNDLAREHFTKVQAERSEANANTQKLKSDADEKAHQEKAVSDANAERDAAKRADFQKAVNAASPKFKKVAFKDTQDKDREGQQAGTWIVSKQTRPNGEHGLFDVLDAETKLRASQYRTLAEAREVAKWLAYAGAHKTGDEVQTKKLVETLLAFKQERAPEWFANTAPPPKSEPSAPAEPISTTTAPEGVKVLQSPAGELLRFYSVAGKKPVFVKRADYENKDKIRLRTVNSEGVLKEGGVIHRNNLLRQPPEPTAIIDENGKVVGTSYSDDEGKAKKLFAEGHKVAGIAMRGRPKSPIWREGASEAEKQHLRDYAAQPSEATDHMKMLADMDKPADEEPSTTATPASGVEASPSPTTSNAPAPITRKVINKHWAAARAAYFTPGNIVRSYGGQDRVVSYSPDEDGNWRVVVHAVDAEGKDIEGERDRSHMTEPKEKDLLPIIKGMVSGKPLGSSPADNSKTPAQQSQDAYDEHVDFAKTFGLAPLSREDFDRMERAKALEAAGTPDYAPGTTIPATEMPPDATGLRRSYLDPLYANEGWVNFVAGETRTFRDKVWPEAMEQVSKNREAGSTLVDELLNNPRALDDTEYGVLAHEFLVRRQNYEAAMEAVATAKGPVELQQADQRVARTRDAYFLAGEAAKLAKRKNGQGLNAIRLAIKDDFSLAKLIHVQHQLSGRVLTGEESQAIEKEMTELHGKYDTVTKELEAKQAEIAQLNGALEALRRGQHNQIPAQERLLSKDGRAALARLKAKLTKPMGLPPSDNDAAYLDAVAKGDIETAQRMVDEAARGARYSTEKLFHGTTKPDFDEFEPYAEGNESAIFATDDRHEALKFADHWSSKGGSRRVIPLYAVQSLMKVNVKGQIYDPQMMDALLERAKDASTDGIKIQRIRNFEDGKESTTVAVFSPNSFKSARAVTRDAQGRVIPLSERFNPKSNSILHTPPAENEEFRDLSIFGASIIEAGANTFEAFSKGVEAELPGALAAHDANAVYEAAQQHLKTVQAQVAKDRTPAGAADRIKTKRETSDDLTTDDLNRLALALVEHEKISAVAPLVKRMHEIVEGIFPGISKKDMARAWTNIENPVFPNQDPSHKTVRDLKRQEAAILKREIVEKEKRLPDKGGPQRDAPSDLTRKYERELNDAIRDSPLQPASAPMQMKSAQAKMETALTHRRDDLLRQIAARKRDVRSTTATKETPKMAALRTEIQSLNRKLQLIDPKNTGISSAQRVKMMESAAVKSIAALDTELADLDRLIKAGSVAGAPQKAKAAPGPSSPKLDLLRKERDAKSELRDELRNQLDDMRDVANPVDPVKDMLDDLFKRQETPTAARPPRVRSHLERLMEANIKAPTPSFVADAMKFGMSQSEAEHAQKIVDAEYERRDRLATRAYKRRIQRSIDYQEKKAQAFDADSPLLKKTPQQVLLDKEADDLLYKQDLAKREVLRAQERLRLRRRSAFRKGADLAVRWNRGLILLDYVVLYKLGMAAMWRTAITPMEEVVGAGISAVLPGLANNAPRGGFFSVKAEAQAVTEGFKYMLENFGNVLKNGRSSLDSKYSAKPDFGDLDPSLADWIGNTHAAIKLLPKANEFYRSFQKRIEAGMRAGRDVMSPVAIQAIGAQAYLDAQRAIFMNPNFASELWRGAIQAARRSKHVPEWANLTADAMEIAMPIVKVPTNIVFEGLGSYIFGLLREAPFAAKSAWQAAVGKNGEGFVKRFNDAYAKLPEEQAEAVMRHLKKGAIGNALGLLIMLSGVTAYQLIGGLYTKGMKPDDSLPKTDRFRLPGSEHDLPRWMFHNPLFDAMHFFTTLSKYATAAEQNRNKAKDKAQNKLEEEQLRLEKATTKHQIDAASAAVEIAKQDVAALSKVQTQNALAWVLAQSAGLAKTVVAFGDKAPLIGGMAKNLDALPDSNQADYLKKEMAASRMPFAPTGVANLAKDLDSDANGEPIKRKLNTFLDHIINRIPVARATLERKDGDTDAFGFDRNTPHDPIPAETALKTYNKEHPNTPYAIPAIGAKSLEGVPPTARDIFPQYVQETMRRLTTEGIHKKATRKNPDGETRVEPIDQKEAQHPTRETIVKLRSMHEKALSEAKDYLSDDDNAKEYKDKLKKYRSTLVKP